MIWGLAVHLRGVIVYNPANYCFVLIVSHGNI